MFESKFFTMMAAVSAMVLMAQLLFQTFEMQNVDLFNTIIDSFSK